MEEEDPRTVEVDGMELHVEGIGDEQHTGLSPRAEAWRRRSAMGAILSGIAFGLKEALEPERDEPAIVVQVSGDPIGDRPVEASLDDRAPKDSVVTIRPWLLPEDSTEGAALAAPVGAVPAWASRAASRAAGPAPASGVAGAPAPVPPVVPLPPLGSPPAAAAPTSAAPVPTPSITPTPAIPAPAVWVPAGPTPAVSAPEVPAAPAPARPTPVAPLPTLPDWAPTALPNPPTAAPVWPDGGPTEPPRPLWTDSRPPTSLSRQASSASGETRPVGVPRRRIAPPRPADVESVQADEAGSEQEMGDPLAETRPAWVPRALRNR